MLTVACVLIGCSSSKNKDDIDLENNQIVEEVPQGAEGVGLLPFFPGLEKGIMIKEIAWGQPTSADNPGVDCDLMLRKAGLYSCRVKRNNQYVHILLQESVKKKNRKLLRFVVQGSGESLYKFWTNTVLQNGYRKMGTASSAKGTDEIFESDDKKTKLETSWSAATKNVKFAFYKNGLKRSLKVKSKRSK